MVLTIIMMVLLMMDVVDVPMQMGMVGVWRKVIATIIMLMFILVITIQKVDGAKTMLTMIVTE